MTLGWPWPILQQGQILSVMLLFWKRVKIVNFSETIAGIDLKVGTRSQLNKYMSQHGYQRSRSLLDFGTNHSDKKIITSFSEKPQGRLKPNFYESFLGWRNESLFKLSWSHGQEAPLPYMLKTLQKSSLEPLGRMTWNLVCSIGDSGPWYFVQMMTWVDLDLFYARVKFGQLCFCIGKLLATRTI